MQLKNNGFDLQARAVDDLHVDSELLSIVVEDKDTNAATARLEGAGEAADEVGLVNDGEALLDVAGLGHGGDVTIGEVEDAILLEDRAEHGLDDDAGGRVGDEGRLLVQLLGEEVDTKVAVLTGGGRGGDADDLARTTLQHQEVAEADVVAGDGDGVGDKGVAGVTGTGTRSRGLDFDIVGVVVLIAARVNNAVSQLVYAVAERVVVTVFVVVTHLGLLVGARVTNWLDSVFGDLDVLLVGTSGRNAVVNGEFVDEGVGVVVVTVTRVSVYSSIVLRTEALTVLTFSNVDGA